MATVNARPLLLLVEDYADAREMYVEFLSASFDVVAAADAHAALEVLATQVPAVVITDFTLPGIDGCELIRRMRGTASTRGVPAILLSGHGGSDHERKAREAGCDLVLQKPCAPDALARSASELINRAAEFSDRPAG
jgi:two-component system, cell cycle response regulator DivK